MYVFDKLTRELNSRSDIPDWKSSESITIKTSSLTVTFPITFSSSYRVSLDLGRGGLYFPLKNLMIIFFHYYFFLLVGG